MGQVTREVLSDVLITDIKLNQDNPRVNDTAVADVAKSIEVSGYISPIIVDETNLILAGNTRCKALHKLGWTIVPTVIRVSGLTEEQKKRFILADNKTHEIAEWDWDKLDIFGEAMLRDVGFSEDEVALILGLGDAGQEVVDPFRLEPIIVEGPNAIPLKGRGMFHCDSKKELEEIKAFFATPSEGHLDKEKLLKLIREVQA